ncbi:MAG: glycosyltransferase family 39 protein [Verrucomicrobiota bacterium]
MHWLQSLDDAVFRFLNGSLSNPVFDAVMPFFSGNALFVPVVLVAAAMLAWKGGVRGRVCLFMLVLVVAIGDGLICNSLKDSIGRLRPFNVLTDANVLVGKGGSGSMPSSHAANWFSAVAVLFIYYRGSLKLAVPLALLVGFSRIYNGVHYPSDVLAGALLGLLYGTGIVYGADALWQRVVLKWFPPWRARLGSLRNPQAATADSSATETAAGDVYWMRGGYLLVAIVTLARLWYLAAGKIELSEDEAYQWLWSKHLALSYFSKPPMIAYAQWLGTSIWGDTAFGVRFLSPLISATMSVLLLRFLAREANARCGFWLVAIAQVVPLMAVGSTLMTVDPLNVLFWTAAMVSGWHAIQKDSTKHWLWTGLWMGLGFLSKYTSLFQLLSFAVFFAVWPAARAQLKRPGPSLALVINALCSLPVLLWNQQHGWITVKHLENRAGLEQAWQFRPNFIWDFVLQEFALLHPIFFVALWWAAIALWRNRAKSPLQLYLFSMGAPLFLVYFLYTVRARVQPNWIAPSVLPLLCLMVVFWEDRWRAGVKAVKPWLTAGLLVGLVMVVLMHESRFLRFAVRGGLPPDKDWLTRVRGWRETAKVVDDQRRLLEASGQPVFIIGSHYGITGLLSFYIPEAAADPNANPLVYYQSAEHPENQFYFWPGYKEMRRGQNAIYVQVLKNKAEPEPPPERLVKEFAEVTDLGKHDVAYRGRTIRTLRLLACRELK